MKRFVTYLYECKNGCRVKNIGYLRVDVRNQMVNIQVSIRQQEDGDRSGDCYLIVQGELLYGIRIGTCVLKEGQCRERFCCTYQGINQSPFCMKDVIGVGIRFDNGDYASSSWKDEADEVVAVGQFSIYNSKDKSTDSVAMDTDNICTDINSQCLDTDNVCTAQNSLCVDVDNVCTAQNSLCVDADNVCKAQNSQSMNTDNICTDMHSPCVNIDGQLKVAFAQEESIKAVSEFEDMQKIQRQATKVEDTLDEEKEKREKNPIEILEETAKTTEFEIQAAESENSLSYQKINLNEIYMLPSKYWHFGNNSFLIHGFWNYGYLVLKEEMEKDKTKISLGVPGIFEQPERGMAAFFGFPQFKALPSEVVEMVIGEEYVVFEQEKNQQPKTGEFGCWFVNL